MPPPIIPPAFPPGFPPEEEPAPEDVPAPEEVPVPIEPTTPVPPVVPQPTGERWLQVLSETQAYSLTMDPLWIAQPGEWYSVALEEDGWVLAVWEHDPPDALVWIRIDPSVELVIVERPELELWLVVTTPTQAYSVTMDPLWVAETGEWYLVGLQEDGWALAVWEHDPPESQVWILIDDRVELVRM
jgi:hypothetical protein